MGAAGSRVGRDRARLKTGVTTGQHGQYWAIAVFILVYGLGSGALAVTRATIPLVFYDKAAYAQAASGIALPLNLVSAAAPPLMVALLTGFGSRTVLLLAIACSCAALAIMAVLGRRRPGFQPRSIHAGS